MASIAYGWPHTKIALFLSVVFQNKLQQTALASFSPSCENFKINCLLGSTEALGCFQFHFYGIWFLSASNMSPFTVHPINSWQLYKLLFKQCQPLVLPMTNIIQIELFRTTPPTHTWNKTSWGKKCMCHNKQETNTEYVPKFLQCYSTISCLFHAILNLS